MRGAHTEKRTRVVRRNDRDHIETYTVTIVDFEFSIDISSHLKKVKPVFYTVADNVPAYRGGMRMATEPNGPTRIESRRLVTGDEQDAQEAWERETEARKLATFVAFIVDKVQLGGHHGSAHQRLVVLQTTRKLISEWRTNPSHQGAASRSG